MTPLDERLQQAMHFHHAGQWTQAEQFYREILQADPEHAEALQLLGALALQTGHSEAAVAYIQRAIARGAGSTFVYSNLGQAYRALGRLDEARACYQEVLRREPGHADAPFQLGVLFHALGRLDEARACYEQALRLRPDRAEAYHRLGVLHQRLGRLDEARACYEQALRLRPDVAEVYNNLGALFKVQGRLDEALACLQRAVRLQPALASAQNNLGAVFQAQGRFDDAAACYQQALRGAPGHADAHNNLGTVFKQQGRLDEAQACYQEALRLKPHYAEAHYNLGALFKERGRLDDARTCYEQALRCQSDHVEVHGALAEVLREQGHLADAQACLEQALRLRPDNAELHNQLGAILQQQDRLADAQACYQRALRLQPELASAHHNLGTVWQAQGRTAEAIACYQQAIRFQPDLALAHLSLGNVFLGSLDRMTEAQACYREALRLQPDLAEAHHNLGQSFHALGELDEARRCFARAQELNPHDGYKIKLALLLPVIAESVADIQQRRHALAENLSRLLGENLVLDDPRAQVGTTTFHLAYHGLNDRDLQAQIAALYARACPSLLYVAPHCLPSAPARTSRPLRVGFISNFFHNHPISRHYAGLLRHLSRQHLRIIVFRFAGPADSLAQSVHEGADAVVTLVAQRGLDALRRQIAAQELDVLFYTDIGMEPWTYFLAFARLAPVQCVTGGHPVTTGIAALDYFISSTDLEPDDAAEHYTEQLVRLHNLPSVFQRPVLTGPPLRRGDFGLPEGAHLYVCAQTLFKLHPDFDDLAAAILEADPRGRLVLFDCQHAELTRRLTDRLCATLGSRTERLLVVPLQPYERYLQLLTLADALLDSPHFSGGTTSFQALGLGAPVVTLPGRFMRGRVTYACYRRLGVLDCVARDAADYVRLAVRLATDRDWHAQVRDKILAANDVLFGNVGVVRELEAFFVEAVARARASR